MNFGKIIGNQEIKDYLIKSIESNNIMHSYLFTGTEGIGKKIIAKDFAKKILCENTKEETCTCKSCTCFSSRNHPDFFILNEDGKGLKIADIRAITEKVIEKPILSNRKVYIINDSEMLNTESQNCILKTLEEPPEFVTFILITSNDNMLLNTIKSRCMTIKFKDIPDEILERFATEIVGYENLTKNQLKSFGGSIANCIRFKENSEKYLLIENLIKDLSNKDIIDIMLNAKIIYDKENIYDILDYMIVCLYEISKEDRRYLNCIEHVNNCITKLKSNANFDMSIDTLLFNMCEEVK